MEKVFIKGSLSRKGNGGYSVLASTSTVDRQGDSIDQAGWDLSNFMKNPVMLWAHDYSALPIAKANNVAVQDEGLVADYEFAPAEGNPMAQQVKTLVDEGFLNAVSVGFMPLERNGNIITKMELFEISFVPVPANPQALQMMLSKGIAHDVITKFFEVKEADIVEAEKGAVADEVAAEEAAELKWAKWDELCEIIGALWSVYFDDATPVESFGALLTEAATLMTALAQTGGTSDDTVSAGLKELLRKGVNKESAKTFLQEFTLKVGAQHSAATKEAIGKAIEHSTKAAAVLTDLLGKTEDGKAAKQEVEPAEVDSEEEETEETSTDEAEGEGELRALLITRDLLRSDNTETFSSLTAVNALIKQREVAKV